MKTILIASLFNILIVSTISITAKEKLAPYVERFPIVKMETSMGDIVIELDRHRAPLTVENFLGYVTRKQYDNTIIHRVDVNYVVQGGGFKSLAEGQTVSYETEMGPKGPSATNVVPE